MMKTRKANSKAGFTLAEVLIAVAIIAVLGGLAVVGALNMVKSSRQKSLDKIAETIFIAADRNIQAAALSGHSEELGADGDHNVRNGDELAQIVLPAEAVSGDINAGDYYISYKVDGSLYAVQEVFYTTAEFKNDSLWATVPNDSLRGKENKNARDGKVGWCGINPESAQTLPNQPTSNPEKIKTTLKLTNKELLVADIFIGLPSVDENPTLYYENNNERPRDAQYTLTITGIDSGAVCAIEGTMSYSATSFDLEKRGYYASIPIDKLEPGLQFKNLVNGTYDVSKVDYVDRVVMDSSNKLFPGEDILVELSATCGGVISMPFEDLPNGFTMSAQENSLYDTLRFFEGDDGSDPGYDTVKISYCRHLQNLDRKYAGIPDEYDRIIHVEQTKTLNFTRIGGEADEYDYWRSVYPTLSYCPVINDRIDVFDGMVTWNEAGGITSKDKDNNPLEGIKNVTIARDDSYNDWDAEHKTNLGIFGKFCGSSITNVNLEGIKISKPNYASGGYTRVGNLVGNIVYSSDRGMGENDDHIVIKDCVVSKSEIEYTETGANQGEIGGLIGRSSARYFDLENIKVNGLIIYADGGNHGTGTNQGGIVGGLGYSATNSSESGGQSYVTMKNLQVTQSVISEINTAGGALGGLVGSEGAKELTVEDCKTDGVMLYSANNTATKKLGGLIGHNGGAVTITNCSVEVSDQYAGMYSQAGLGSGVSTDNAKYYVSRETSNTARPLAINSPWIWSTDTSGECIAAGFVAYFNGVSADETKIENSFASTIILAEGPGSIAGGLAGANNGSGSNCVKMNESYADCYIGAVTVGGLAGKIEASGSNQPEFTKCYSAGFVLGTNAETAGGISTTKSTVTNCLSLFNYDNIFDDTFTAVTFDANGYIKGYPSETEPAESLTTVYLVAGLESTIDENTFYTYGGDGDFIVDQYDDENIKCDYAKIKELVEKYGKNRLTAASNPDRIIPYKYAPTALSSKLNSVAMPELINVKHYGDWLEKPEMLWSRIFANGDGTYTMYFERGAWKKNGHTEAPVIQWQGNAEDGFLNVAVVPWASNGEGWSGSNKSKITKVIFTEKFCKSAETYYVKDWFKDFTGLTEIEGMDMFDTSLVKDMSHMFYNCNKIRIIDCSGFVTTNVTNYYHMFRACSKLTTIFATDAFYVDSGAYTSLACWDCPRLVGGEGTPCQNLQANNYRYNEMMKLDRVVTAGEPGYFTDIETSGAALIEKTGVDNEFRLHIYHAKSDTYTAEKASFLASGTLEKDLGKFNIGGYREDDDYPWHSYRRKIVDVKFHDRDKYRLTSMRKWFKNFEKMEEFDADQLEGYPLTNFSEMFYGCSKLKRVDMSKWNTHSVTTTDYMFYNCVKLESINVTGWDTTNVKNMGGMFYYCSIIKLLDLRSFSTANVTSFEQMFRACGRLRTILATDDFVANDRANCSLMFWDDGRLIGGEGTKAVYIYNDNYNYRPYVKIDRVISTGVEGYFTDISTCGGALLLKTDAEEEYELHMYYADKNRGGTYESARAQAESDGTLYKDLGVFNIAGYRFADDYPWHSYRRKIVEAKFHDTDKYTMTSMMYWFCDFSIMKSFDASQIKNQPLTDLTSTFSGCSVLESIDMHTWTTGHLKTTSYMFYECKKLTSVNVSNWDTTAVIDMSGMFYRCSAIKTLDLRSFNTANVTSFNQMFRDNGRLHTIFATDDFIAKDNADCCLMFWENAHLIGGEGTKAVNITAQNYNYRPYVKLDRIVSTGVPGYFTEISTCGGALLIKTDVEEEYVLHIYYADSSNGGTYEAAKEAAENDGSLFMDLGPFNIAGYRFAEDYPWHSYRGNIVDAKFHDQAKYTLDSMMHWFSGFTKMKNFDASQIKNQPLTDLTNMFYGCTALESIDMHTWDTSHLKTTSYMFYGCNKLTSVDVTNWDTRSVTDMSGMFYRCSIIKTLDLRSFDTSSVTSFNQTFRDCGRLRTIFATDAFTVSDSTDCSLMFWENGHLIGGEGTKAVNITAQNYNYRPYAKLDRAVSTGVPGYLTDMKTCLGALLLNTATEDEYILHLYYADSENGGTYDIAKAQAENDGTLYKDLGMLNVAGYRFAEDYPWHSYRGNIVDAKFHDQAKYTLDSMMHWFSGFTKMKNFDASQIKNQPLTDLTNMFYGCTALESIDMHTWDTSHLKTTSYMFYGCNKLTSVDVTNWDTRSVTDMSGMFYRCSIIKTLDLRSFDTSSVTSFNQTFRECGLLRTIFVTDIFIVTDRTDCCLMFWEDGHLIGGEGTKAVNITAQNYNYRPYAKLDRAVSEGVPGYLTDMKTCLGALLIKSANEGEYELKIYYADSENGGTYDTAKALAESNGSLQEDLGMFNIAGYRFAGDYPWHSNRGKIISVEFNDREKYNLTSMMYWFTGFAKMEAFDGNQLEGYSLTDLTGTFDGCSELTSLDMHTWDTSHLKTTCSMFNGCKKIKEFDFTGWDTTSVTSMNDMFYNCSSVKTLDLRSFNTANVTNFYDMFRNCSELTTIYATDDLCGLESANYQYMFLYSPKLIGGEGTHSSDLLGYKDYRQYARVDNPSEGKPGYYTNYSNCLAALIEKTANADEYKLHIYFADSDNGGSYEASKNSMESEGLLEADLGLFNKGGYKNAADYPWHKYRPSIVDVEFHDGGAYQLTSMRYWFSGFTRMTSFDAGQLAGYPLKDLTGMFSGCSSLNKLDMSSWDTSGVTSLNAMFNECRSLTTLAFTGWVTTNVTTMKDMFYNCVSIKSLNLSSFNAANVTSFENMFRNCTELKTIFATNDLCGSETANYQYMFLYSLKLIGGEGTHGSDLYGYRDYRQYARVDRASVGEPGYYTNYANSLAALLEKSSTAGEYRLHIYFADSSNGGSYESSISMMESDGTLEADLGLLSTGGYKNASDYPWYDYRTNIVDVEFHDRESYQLISMRYWFSGFTRMTSFDAGQLAGYPLKDVTGMFNGCSALTSMDMSSWDTSALTSTSQMFNDCIEITSLDFTGWDTTHITDMSKMFYNCKKIKVMDMRSFSTANATSMSEMFRFCERLTTILATDNFVASASCNCQYIFLNSPNIVGGQGTRQQSLTDYSAYKQYIRVDRKLTGQPGYFTDVESEMITDGYLKLVISTENGPLTVYYYKGVFYATAAEAYAAANP
ncbi:BspA family leucine-rich repeat surface protein [Butyrivibrio sp. AE3006]|uniref:BspA family leucine-rich repeat surface protein n=1 Tax=Butyrivibrio sp. AE3006 TaxID=1280673 RepID=UPI000401FEA2|nr:BspA family leucine-rich repeat surface protein [Butyrivibrio sp. AE3006]